MPTNASTRSIFAACSLALLSASTLASNLPNWPTAGAGRGFSQIQTANSAQWPIAGAGRGFAQVPKLDAATADAAAAWPTAGAGRGLVR